MTVNPNLVKALQEALAKAEAGEMTGLIMYTGSDSVAPDGSGDETIKAESIFCGIAPDLLQMVCNLGPVVTSQFLATARDLHKTIENHMAEQAMADAKDGKLAGGDGSPNPKLM